MHLIPYHNSCITRVTEHNTITHHYLKLQGPHRLHIFTEADNYVTFSTISFHQHFLGGASACCSHCITYDPYAIHHNGNQQVAQLRQRDRAMHARQF